MSLKELTAENHALAETTPFMKSVFANTLPMKVWIDYTFQKEHWYRAIENNAQKHGLLEVLSGIERADLILSDYDEMTEGQVFSHVYKNSTKEYYNYITSLNDPKKILAHLYTWHMGDMFGGQMIKKIIVAPHRHLEFENRTELMSNLRTLLTDELADEANVAFTWAIKILNEYNTEFSIVDQVEACAEQIETRFRKSGEMVRLTLDQGIGLKDIEFESAKYRRAHLSIIDSRNINKLYFLHVTVFPHTNNLGPIYGFDIIAGPTRVSGAFHDFSKSGQVDDNMTWFAERTKNIAWNKKRELPDWAKTIFSSSIVAIGAVGPEELTEFISLGLETLDYYLDNINETNNQTADTTEQQNFYCRQQRLNPHTPRVLTGLGFTQTQAIEFIENTLFPII